MNTKKNQLKTKKTNTMKDIDIKSLIIGALLTSTIFLGVAAVPKDTGTSTRPDAGGAWDDKQEWTIQMQKRVGSRASNQQKPIGYQPFAVNDEGWIYWRKRIK